MSDDLEDEYLYTLLEVKAEEEGITDMLEMGEQYSELFDIHVHSEDESGPVETIVSNNTR